jgi:PAS domain S-box-containing protein
MAAGLYSFVAAYRVRVFLAVALASTAAYALNSDSNWQAAIALGICSASTAALALRMRFAETRCDAAWWLLLVSQVALLGSFGASWPDGPLAVGVAAAQAAAGLAIASFACLIVVVMLFCRRRDGSRWALLDVVTIAVGLGLLAAPFLDRVLETESLSVTARGMHVATTAACALLLAGALRLLVTPGRRLPALWLVVAGCGGVLGAGLSWNWLSVTGHDGRTYAELGLLLYAALVGAAALTPNTTRKARPRSRFVDHRSAAGFIIASFLVAPSLVGFEVATHAERALILVAGCGATVMSLLVAARLVVLLDHSERLTLELSRRNAELAEHALLVQSSDHAVFACNPDAVIKSWNPAAERLYGYSAAEAIGRSIIDLTAPLGGEEQLQNHRARLRQGETVTGHHGKRRRKDGSLFDAVLTISPAYDDAGEVITFFSIVRDETEELTRARERDDFHMATQLAAEQLAEQVERLRELDRMKDDFVASVSHELRTPLTSIGGYLDLVLDREGDELTEEQRHFLEVVGRNSQRLLRLVNDLLDVAHLGAGNLVLEPVACAAVPLVAECVERAEAVARNRGIQLRLETRTDARLEADPMRLGQVVDNLLSNALKFTPDGGTVDVRVVDCPCGVAIEVADTGLGISPSVQDRLFERFYRAPEATDQAIQGTGLGLWITKKIIVAHGGTIGVESVPGHGSTFRIELPTTLPAGAEAAA